MGVYVGNFGNKILKISIALDTTNNTTTFILSPVCTLQDFLLNIMLVFKGS